MKRGAGLALPWEVSLPKAVLLLPQMALLVLLFPLLDVMAAEYNSALTFDDMGFVSDDEAVDGIRVFMRR